MVPVLCVVAAGAFILARFADVVKPPALGSFVRAHPCIGTQGSSWPVCAATEAVGLILSLLLPRSLGGLSHVPFCGDLFEPAIWPKMLWKLVLVPR